MNAAVRRALLGAAIVAAVAGCAGGQPTTSGPTVPTPPPSYEVPIVTLGATPSATLTPAPTVRDLPDPCDLLSAADARAALGVPFGPGVSTSDDDFRTCTFTSSGPFEASLSLATPIRVEDPEDFFDPSASIVPGIGDGSQFAVKELSSPRPGADFGFFTLSGQVGIAIEYSAFGQRSASPGAGSAGTTVAPTADPSALGAQIESAVGSLAAKVVARLGTR
jgi:hypothetical protein